MTRHDSEAEKCQPPEDVQVIKPGSGKDGSHHTKMHRHADASHADRWDEEPSRVDTSLNAAHAADSLLPLQEPLAASECIVTDCFTSISNLRITTDKPDDTPFDSFSLPANLVIKEHRMYAKWDWLLFYVVIFALISTFSLIWLKGLGIIKLSEGDLKIYLVGWSSQMMALVIHRVRSLFSSKEKKSGK